MMNDSISVYDNAYDRYMDFFDRAVAGAAQIDELRTIFAPDATVEIHKDPVTGIEAILPFYEAVLARLGNSKHFWNTSRVDDTTIEADWVAAIRLKDGNLTTLGGFERARLDANGLIVHLRNYPDKAAA